MKSLPNLDCELELWKKGFLVAGVDEVGRGSFAGPLVVGAVVLKPVEEKSTLEKLLSLGINDSKLMSIKDRKRVIKLAQSFIFSSSIQYISEDIINAKSLGFANKKGFELAAKDIVRGNEVSRKLSKKETFFLTDYFKIPKIKKSLQKNIIRGDSISVSVALASILAKVERDRFMGQVAKTYKVYGFERNKGYGTKFHRSKIKEHGPCPIHRTVFVQNYI